MKRLLRVFIWSYLLSVQVVTGEIINIPCVQPIFVQPDPNKAWVLDERFSDEFETGSVDEVKWEKDMRPWGDRSWKSAKRQAGNN